MVRCRNQMAELFRRFSKLPDPDDLPGADFDTQNRGTQLPAVVRNITPHQAAIPLPGEQMPNKALDICPNPKDSSCDMHV